MSGRKATRGGWASPRRPPGAGPGASRSRGHRGPQAPLLARWADLGMRSKARPALRAVQGLAAPPGQPGLPVDWGLEGEVGLITCWALGPGGV